MNYSLCCRSGRRVAVAVIPVTNAVGTFFPVLLAVIFQQFHSSVYSVTGSRVGSSHFPGPSAALRDCRIYFRLTFRCFQVYFFFPSHQLSCRAMVNKPHCRYAWQVVVYWEQQQWGKGGWPLLVIPINIFFSSGGRLLGVISTLLGEVTHFQVLQNYSCNEQHGREACNFPENGFLKTLWHAPDWTQHGRERGEE